MAGAELVLIASFFFSGFTADALTQGNMLVHIGHFVMAMFPALTRS